MKPGCVIEGCDRPHKAHGWCVTHYQRWRKHGDPLTVRQIRGDDEARFWTKAAHSDGCRLWTGPLTRDGYGRFQVDGRLVLAHRWAYEHWVGPIPEGLEIDHLCRVRNCVWPEHLEPVTHLENVRRGVRPPLKTHCPQGHEYAGDNLYVNPAGYRECRTCSRAATRRWKMARAAA